MMRARAPEVVKVAALLLALTAAATGCKASVHIGGSPTIPKASVEKKTATELAAKTNQPEPAVTCPDALAAKVGATLDCTLLAQGETQRYPVHLEVDSVSGDGGAHFQISVGSAPIADSTTETTQP